MRDKFFTCRGPRSGKHRENAARDFSTETETRILEIKYKDLPPASSAICANSSTEIGASYNRMR